MRGLREGGYVEGVKRRKSERRGRENRRPHSLNMDTHVPIHDEINGTGIFLKNCEKPAATRD